MAQQQPVDAGLNKASVDDAKQDISNALLALGYNEKEAATAMKVLPADIVTSDGIRQALKLLSKV